MMADKRSTVTLEMVAVESEGTTLLGIVETTESQPASTAPATDESLPASVEAANVPERLELVAEREIVLRCGEASVTLTRAGKIILRGTYVLSRSSGVNRIAGGSVQIN